MHELFKLFKHVDFQSDKTIYARRKRKTATTKHLIRTYVWTLLCENIIFVFWALLVINGRKSEMMWMVWNGLNIGSFFGSNCFFFFLFLLFLRSFSYSRYIKTKKKWKRTPSPTDGTLTLLIWNTKWFDLSGQPAFNKIQRMYGYMSREYENFIFYFKTLLFIMNQFLCLSWFIWCHFIVSTYQWVFFLCSFFFYFPLARRKKKNNRTYTFFLMFGSGVPSMCLFNRKCWRKPKAEYICSFIWNNFGNDSSLFFCYFHWFLLLFVYLLLIVV